MTFNFYFPDPPQGQNGNNKNSPDSGFPPSGSDNDANGGNNDPSKFYENLPFHGLQNNPNKQVRK